MFDHDLVSLTKTKDDLLALDKVIVASNCVISNFPCSVKLPDNSVIEIVSSSAVIKALEPIQIEIQYIQSQRHSLKKQSSQPQAFSLYFSGREMEMGSHILVPNPQEGMEEKVFSFQGMIPVCSVDPRMAWNLTTEFKLNDKLYVVINALDTDSEH